MKNQNTETAAVKTIVEETKKPFALPYKITCSRCGTQKAVRHEVLLKRLVGFKGTVEERYNEYAKTCTCQSCRRDIKLKAIEAEMNKDTNETK